MRIIFASLILFLGAGSAVAQQRPLLTEDPETIGAGRVLVEGGVEYDDDAVYPVSGLRGNLWRGAVVGGGGGGRPNAGIQIVQNSFFRLSLTTPPPPPLSELGPTPVPS